MNEGDFEPLNGKRKRGMNKSMSVTPSVMDDEEEDRDMVCQFLFDQKLFSDYHEETTENQIRRTGNGRQGAHEKGIQ
jgi:hypothetical protein